MPKNALLAFCRQGVSFQTQSKHLISLDNFSLNFKFSFHSGIHEFMNYCVCHHWHYLLVKAAYNLVPICESHATFASTILFMLLAYESPILESHCSTQCFDLDGYFLRCESVANSHSLLLLSLSAHAWESLNRSVKTLWFVRFVKTLKTPWTDSASSVWFAFFNNCSTIICSWEIFPGKETTSKIESFFL